MPVRTTAYFSCTDMSSSMTIPPIMFDDAAALRIVYGPQTHTKSNPPTAQALHRPPYPALASPFPDLRTTSYLIDFSIHQFAAASIVSPPSVCDRGQRLVQASAVRRPVLCTHPLSSPSAMPSSSRPTRLPSSLAVCLPTFNLRFMSNNFITAIPSGLFDITTALRKLYGRPRPTPIQHPTASASQIGIAVRSACLIGFSPPFCRDVSYVTASM